ncbi:MAG: hypothetical protein A2Y73_07560 [Chloroflexi bacterium RBG_13_56_8]|nr:MAG: hypothetical protein A2Y73_07560 [Chloroflexi bacterium RBG_13_56_8]
MVARLTEGVLDIVAAISGAYYSRKYAAIVKRLGLPRAEASKRRGFVVIQIDGLSHLHLLSAMRLGYAPYMQRLVQRGEFALQPWCSGLPCTTPAAQAGILYGNNEDIPAFRWYEKEKGASVVCKGPRVVKAIQDRVSRGRRGILAGGSSFVNMFDGDASLSMFTLGALNHKRFFESVRGLGFVLLFVLNPFRSLKMILLAIWEYLTDITQQASALLRRKGPRPLEHGFTLLRVITNVISREIQTFAVMVDIYRGVPAIYTTYYGYDELAHNYGPLSTIALRALRAIDVRIRQIDALRRRALTREYDLFVLSDHGMTEAIPFREAYEQSLGDLIHHLVGDEVRVDEAFGSEQQEALRAIYLANELAAIEDNVRKPLGYIPRKIRRLVLERIALDEEAPPWDFLRRTEVVVRNSGSMSHVYFNVSGEKMNISEIAALFPTLMSDLASHPGIWLVIGREDQQVVVMSQGGVLSLDGGYDIEGSDPLAILPNPRLAAAQLQRLTHFPHSGDLILMGSYDPDGQVVSCFEQQWACHGGLGGPQETAFMMTEKDLAWDLDQVEQATDLYPLFAACYGI